MGTNTNKKTAAKKAASEAVSKNYDEKTAISVARRNGNALRVATAKNSGEYTISSTSKAGTPIALRSIFEKYFPKAASASASDFGIAIERVLSEPNGIAELSKAVSKETGKEYGNAKTLLRRIRGNIKNGEILRFRLLA